MVWDTNHLGLKVYDCVWWASTFELINCIGTTSIKKNSYQSNIDIGFYSNFQIA